MAQIHVPRPPGSAYNPNRKASSLLRTQVEHMHLAEKRLPLRYRTQIYVNAIETEGEVAQYIGQVTEAIRKAHEDARKKKTKTHARRPGTVLQMAASAPRKKSKGESSRPKAADTSARAKKKTPKKK